MPCLKRIRLSEIHASIAGNNQVAKKFDVLTFAKLLIAIPRGNLTILLTLGTILRKLFLFVAICIMCCSCFPQKDLQAELTYATLVKVEEVNRYPNLKQKIFTWETAKLISFKTFESSSMDIPIGTKTRVLVFR
jgi:hypothetical protein